MDSITVKNFRCFGEEQTVRLAPLTLLVGDNSTGKTSFLALIRALSYVGYADMPPNFRQAPYDLGSFGEIVHVDSGKDGTSDSFEAGFTIKPSEVVESETNGHHRVFDFRATFKNRRGVPYPIRRWLGDGINWIEHSHDGNHGEMIQAGVGTRLFETTVSEHVPNFVEHLLPLVYATHLATRRYDDDKHDEDTDAYHVLRSSLLDEFYVGITHRPPFASSPVRTRPSRTYDPIDVTRDPEGENIPTYLARTSMIGGDEWKELQGRLIEFGRDSGLFDDFKIEHLGKSEGSPFQIHVRKHGHQRKGKYRNLVDVGYGISQILPILTELFREDGARMLLLQQPEIHLHPSAQAALGTLFCSMAAAGKQLIVETHSDHLLDRVRMDVRDKITGLKPEDVSILYFERSDSGTKVHSIMIDQQGDMLGAPLGYRQFFMDEINRSIGLVRLEA